jgi:hypothetical protein
MRNIKKLSLLVILLSVSILFTSCKKDDDPVSSNGSEVIGVWVLSKVVLTSMGNIELTPDQVGTTVTFDIKANNTFTATVNDTSGVEVETGTWSVANGKISMKSEGGETEEMAYTVNGNQLSVETIYDIPNFGLVPVKLVFTKQ